MSRAVLFTLLCAVSFAQEVPPPEIPEPPRWIPYYVVPGPSPREILELEAHGRHTQKVGGVLMASGGTVAAVGMGLWIAGAVDDDHCTGFVSHPHDDHHCGASGLSIGGAVTNIIGTAVFVSGIIVHLKGGDDVKRARDLQRQLWRPISLEPRVGPKGGGLSLTFRH
jgi:hypothetical protein